MSARSDQGIARTTGAAAVPSDTLVAVQYLRALAAMAVTLYHALQWADGGFEVGQAGVDIFFVISGVIMWRVTAGRPVSPGAFLARRASRVAPLYWVMTLLVGAIALVWRGFLPEVIPDAGHLAASLAFIPHYDPLGRPFPLLPPGWTLNYEAAFYLLFAATLLLPLRRRAAAITAALFAIVAAGFLLNDPFYQLGANPMLLQFAAGVWLGVALETRRLPHRAWGLGLILLGLSAFAAFQIGGPVDPLWRPLLWGVPAAFLVGGALSLEADGAVPRLRGLVRLGDASYALYLVHLPATALVAHTLGWGNPWLFALVSMGVSILAALGCHLWMERPLVAAARRLLSSASIGRM